MGRNRHDAPSVRIPLLKAKDEIYAMNTHKVAVVIPSYRVRNHICQVLARIGPEVHRIYVVDDACPDGSGLFVERECKDPRVRVLHHSQNRGVGGAVMTGYLAAIDEGADILVKIDGDGQMDPALLPDFIAPLIAGVADYAKGNRFYDLRHVSRMPAVRLLGNACLSFMAKLSTGYWHIFDPTNGYTALHARVAERLPFDRISNRYFFETDMLFRLGTLRCVVTDVPMDAVYGAECSSLSVRKAVGEFLLKHMRNLVSRIFYTYILRDFSIATIELFVGVALLAFGIVFGALTWLRAIDSMVPTPLGTIMLSALATLAGVQFTLAFLAYDMTSAPRQALAPSLRPHRTMRTSGAA